MRMEMSPRQELRQEVKLGLVQKAELRLEQTLKMELRLSQRLEMLILPELQAQVSMNIKGVDDPTRVRVFSIVSPEGKKLKIVSKRIDLEKGEDPYQEAANILQLKKMGVRVPTLMGVAKSDDHYFLITEFDEKTINVGTIMSKPAIFKQYLETGDSVQHRTVDLFSSLAASDQLALANQMLSYFPLEKQKSLREIFKVHLDQLGYTRAGQAIAKTLEKEDIGILSLIPKKYLKGLLRPVYQKIALALGQELRSLHEKGIILKNISPRNLLVTIQGDKENKAVEISHTGLKHAHIHQGAPSEREKQVNLLHLKTAFQNIGDHLTQDFEKAFLEGYCGSSFGQDEKTPETIENEGNLTIADATRKKLQALFRGKSDATHVSPDATPEKKEFRRITLAKDMLQVVLETKLEDLKFQNLMGRLLELLKEFLQRPGGSREENYTFQVLQQLYQFFIEHGKKISEWSDIEGFKEASLIMDPVLQEYQIPGAHQIEYFLEEALVLRFHKEYPHFNEEELLDSLWKALKGRFPFRKQDYRKALSRLASLSEENCILKPEEVKNIKAYLKECWERSTPMNITEYSKRVQRNPKNIEATFNYFRKKMITKHFRLACEKNHAIDLIEMSELSGIPHSEIEGLFEEIKGRYPIYNPKQSRQHRRRTKKIAKPELVPQTEAPTLTRATAVPTQMLKASSAPSLTAVFGPKPTPAPTSEPVSTPTANPEEKMWQLQRAILAFITKEVAMTDEQIAAELGIDSTDVKRIIEARMTQKDLGKRDAEVHRMIIEHPHIDDEGLQRLTGLSITDIHLIVRPHILAGALNPH